MPTLQEILQDQNYLNANPATKKAIFDRWSASDTNYTGANPATQQAIRGRFGVGSIDVAAPEEPQEKSGFLRQVADVPLSIGRGAVTGVRMIADAFGAGSGASEALKGAEGYLASLMSAQSKNDEKEVARILKDAEDKGMLDQVKAGFKAFSVAPVDLLSQGFGTAAPAVLGILGGKVLGAGVLGMSAIGTGVGAGMGAGSAKGGIYEEVKAALKESGVDDAKAEQVALEAQKYGGKNMDQILLSAGLGGLAGRFGLESSARRMLTGAVGKEAGKGAAREIAEGATRTAVTESVPELLQGSQEQVAKNIALQREGFDVSTMRGVGSSGTLEALAGAGLGAVAGASEAGLRRQARGDAAKILADEQKATADAEQARLDAEAAEKAKIPPLALGAEGVLTPVALPDGSVATTPQEVAEYEKQQFEGKYKPQPVPAEPVFQEEPVGKSITGAKPQLEGAPAGGELAGIISGRREAEAAKAEVPLVDDYAFLQREKQRLLQQDQTPDTKKLIGRIDDRIGEVLKRDIERQRADAEAAKTSVFGQKELPPVESRDVVVGNIELGKLQAPERLPDQPLTGREIKSAEKMRTAPPPVADAQARFEQAEMDRRKFMRSKEAKQGNLMDYLKGKLALDEVSDIAPKGKGFEKLANEKGTYISELVSDGMLDEFLPPDQRAGQANFDAQQAAETIKENLRNKVLQPFDLQMQIRQLDDSIAAAEREAKAPKTAEFDMSDVEPGEAASVERAASEQDVAEAAGIRYQRSTAAGPSIGVDRTLEVADAAKKNWTNAPQVVVAENMDDPVIPKSVREHNKAAIAKGAKGKPKGFFYKGKAYILADGMSSDQDVIEALFHESLGHYGLRGTFGPEMGKVLADVVKNRKADVEAKAAQYGLDVNSKDDMLEAAEEVLAEMAQTSPGLSFVKRAISVIRNFLRDLGLPFKMSNNDIIQKYILPARAFVEKGERRAVEGKPAAMREPAKAPPTESAAFKKWFGDSKVVDENGEPLVVYRGVTNEVPTELGATDFFGANLFGRGINLTSSASDASKYASTNVEENLDLTGKASIMADQLGITYKEAKAELTKGGGAVMPVYASIKNPLVVGAEKLNAPDSVLRLALAETSFDGDADRFIRQFNRAESGVKQFEVALNNRATQIYRQIASLQNKDGLIIEPEISPKSGGATHYLAFDPTQIKSATGNIGTYDPENPDIRYQREAEAEPAKTNPTRQNIFGEPVLGTWSITVDPKMELQDGLIYKMLDKNIDVKRIVEAVKSTGKEIASRWNPYLQEELYHGRTADATQEFKDKEWLPLLEDMRDKGVTIGELEKYLLNRHAEDYNKLMAQRNTDRPEMQDGASSVNTADAREYLAGLDKDTKAKYDELAKRIDGITKGTRQLLADTGYEKAKTIKTWEEMFPSYVPLMREEEDFDYNFASFGTGRGFDVRRDFSRSAMGSKRNVVDIIGNVISARNQAISLTEKNRVAQAVYGLALEAPNPDFWLPINPDLAEVREVDRIKQNIAKYMAKKSDPKITDDELDGVKSNLASEYKKLKFAQTKATEAIERVRRELVDLGIPEETINTVMQEPEQRILDPKKGQVVKRVNTKLRENDHVLATRINGEKRYVFFNPKDPRSKRAATALKNLDAQDLGTALGLVAKVTRWMASVNTQYNPIFGPYNFLRDVQSAALQLSTTELAGQQKEIAKLVVPSLQAIYSSLRKRRKGEASDLKMSPAWKEFQQQGGQTGFKDNFSRTQDRTEALLDEMSRLTEGKVKANARAVFDWLSDYNDSLENAVRLAAYVVARDKFIKEGMSPEEAKQKAASLAKNLTVNFNRKGDVATQMGALYAFFNASMQGTARMIETLKGPTGKKIIAGGLLLGGMQAALLAAAGFDDEEPPEFIRSKNIVIPTGDGDYIAFPMPLGFHVIPGVSRILTEWTLSGFKDTARRVTDLTGLFLDAFNPIGNAGWSVQTITPTILDPLVALGENKDWTGKPISKEDLFSLRPTPGYTRAREGANVLSTSLAEFLNYASGGTKHQPGVLSPTPEQIEYLVGQAFGGVGREAMKLATTVEKTATGEELPPYKIPLYGRFVGETKSSAAESNKFYKNMERLNRLDLEIKGRREDREPIGDFMRENPQARLLPMANKTYKDVQELRKRRKELLERDAPRESIQAVEKQITRKMQVLNDRVNAFEESSN